MSWEGAQCGTHSSDIGLLTSNLPGRRARRPRLPPTGLQTCKIYYSDRVKLSTDVMEPMHRCNRRASPYMYLQPPVHKDASNDDRVAAGNGRDAQVT